MVYDVVIVGAGLAGLTLSRQLMMNDNQLKVAVIHNGSFPNPLVTHTVGESSVEIGGFYLRETLGLNDHMDEEHLPKMGLRFMQTQGRSYREYGIECFPYHKAYQIERGKLENHLYNELKSQVDIFTDERFIDFSEQDNSNKTVHTVASDGEEKKYNTRWFVDASGRQRKLVKKLDVARSTSLTHSAVWFRLDTVIDVNNFLADNHEDNIFYGAERRYSTIHMVGAGYWVWIIPIPDGRTSIGIVFDETMHDAQKLVSLDGALEWLSQHEEALSSDIEKHKDLILDFKYYRKYSYNSDFFLSTDRMAVTGEAKGFLDPLYSNGTDFIGIENTMITETILCDRRGDSIEPYCNLYNQFLDLMFECFHYCHVNGYKHFDKWHYVLAKTDIDPIFYFGSFCVVFMNNKIGDLPFMEYAFKEVKEIYEVYKSIIDIIKSDEFYYKNEEVDQYVSIIGSIQQDVNRLIVCNEGESVSELLEDNKNILIFIRDRLKKGEDFYKISRTPSREEFPKESNERYAWLPRAVGL